jgi:hypothetical protein
MISITFGDVLWWAHRFRRVLILSPGLAILVATTALVVRNARHIPQLLHAAGF